MIERTARKTSRGSVDPAETPADRLVAGPFDTPKGTRTSPT